MKTWKITDEFWSKVEPHVPENLRHPEKSYRRKPGGGKKARYSDRLYFSAIVYVLRTGIIWNTLPRLEFEGITSQAVHKKFMQWSQAGFFQRIWYAGLMEYDEMEGIAWEWQSADGSHTKAPMAREVVGPNPTDRGKNGSKKSLFTRICGRTPARGVRPQILVKRRSIEARSRVNCSQPERFLKSADAFAVDFIFNSA